MLTRLPGHLEGFIRRKANQWNNNLPLAPSEWFIEPARQKTRVRLTRYQPNNTNCGSVNTSGRFQSVIQCYLVGIAAHCALTAGRQYTTGIHKNKIIVFVAVASFSTEKLKN